MDHESLRTASTYLNHLLLARGLLRNGDPIDFVKPSRESRAQIINLVHDLVLREDRDRDQRENFAGTLRRLRAEETRQTAEIERLRRKNEESLRALAAAQSAERTASGEMRKVERAMKGLQDQAAKMRVALAQVRTQCANDVRKRDLELARLQTHLQGQQRGNRVGATAPSITVTDPKRGPVRNAKGHDVGDAEYSLKQETTEFLTELSQSLSDENDALIALIRDALQTIRELLGVPADHKHSDSGVGGLNSHAEDDKMLRALPTSYETLSTGMEASLSQLKSILTSPNFVSVEEVEVREEEIVRLREGWEKMEQRWKDILLMMEGWRQKMNTGNTIDMDDLRKGIGMVSPDRPLHRQRADQAGSEPQTCEGDNSLSELHAPSLQDDSSTTPAHHAPPVAKPLSASPKRKRDILEPPDFFDLRPSTKSTRASLEHTASAPKSEPDDDDDDAAAISDPPQLTVAEKLAVARQAAEDAQLGGAGSHAATDVRDVARSTLANGHGPRWRGSKIPVADARMGEAEDDVLPKMGASPMAKRTQIRGRPKRRKSTLSPEELEMLLVGGSEG